MKILSKETLDLFRGPGCCAVCGLPCWREAMHVRAKGHGGGRQIDARLNILSGCRLCHQRSHAGFIPTCTLTAIVSVREKCLQHHIEEAMDFLIALPKRPTPVEIWAHFGKFNLGCGALALVQKTLTEHGIPWEKP